MYLDTRAVLRRKIREGTYTVRYVAYNLVPVCSYTAIWHRNSWKQVIVTELQGAKNVQPK